MEGQLFHVFRNTPFGREMFLQSLYTCSKLGLAASVLVPKHKQYLMYFEHQVVTLELDDSFLTSPQTAKHRAGELARQFGVEATWLEPKEFTASGLPDLPVEFDMITCPRSMSEKSTKIGLGHLGPKVRTLVRNSICPVLIPSETYKTWNSVVVMFGGSDFSKRALEIGSRIARRSGKELSVFSYLENKTEEFYRKRLQSTALWPEVETGKVRHLTAGGDLVEALWHVPHDALVVAGAYGHGIVREVIFGSMIEHFQTRLPNNLVLIGPNCRA
ncbi:MAG: universal stress protein [Deltaproteobacteria bacterium]|nr:MAG: universal stress protein [Deltaproteobacteria bacterium]